MKNAFVTSRLVYLIALILIILLTAFHEPSFAINKFLESSSTIQKALEKAQNQVQFTRIPIPGSNLHYIPEKSELKSYTLGVGDTIDVHLWNKNLNLSYSLTISPEGKVYIPKIGELYVNNLYLREVKSVIASRAGNLQVNVSVILNRVRQVKILLTGQVKNPGYYQVQWGSRLIDLLRLSGGVNNNGSIRQIELRNNHESVIVDLYKFYYDGMISSNPRLKGGEQIHIPSLKKKVAVLGYISQPGIYEIKDKMKLKHLLDIAGNPLPSADPQNFIYWPGGLTSYPRSFQSLPVKNTLVGEGDVIYIQPRQLPEEKSVIYVYGQVHTPGIIQYRKGMTISDCIKHAGGPNDKADLGNLKLSRLSGNKRIVLSINLDNALFNGSIDDNKIVKPGDIIYLPETFFIVKNINELTGLLISSLGIISVIINLSRPQ